MESNTNWQNAGLGLIGIAIFGAIICALFYQIGQAPWQFITILIASLGALITVAGNFNIQVRNEQKPKKVEIYDKVINLFFDSIFAQKLGQEPKTEEELVKSIHDMTPDLILWASDDVLNLYIKFRQMANRQDSSTTPILLFGQMLLAMRKDLGHQNNQINEESILGTFVNDVENLSK
ncbi:hypothetical protein [Microcoleus sp. PH2017_30_WIL_O_A]|uniref:hypothetical protein n=1 Tax=Microcoleus sp. PH2017_30_WIL_O_A TaxID=2798840 RepID=UPI001D8B4D58|nr:hypothetical protein [Microcoleus sp. PH2017_30_WIL_O_A]MCC3588006.1 hypothetical protein [Microcoleus sp. PH2017_30_WIL_O_A]